MDAETRARLNKYAPLEGLGDIIADIEDIVDTLAASAVIGPASSTDTAIARFDGTDGKLVKDSPTTLGDNGTIFSGNGSTPSYVPAGASLFLSSVEDDNGFIIRSEGSVETVESFLSNWGGSGNRGAFAGTITNHPYYFATNNVNRFAISASGETIFATDAVPGGSPFTPFGSVLTAVADSSAALDAFAVYDETGTLKAKIDKDGKFFGPSGSDLQDQITTLSNILSGGASGSFTTVDGKTVTVTDGIITSIV